MDASLFDGNARRNGSHEYDDSLTAVEEYDPTLKTNAQRLPNGAVPLKRLSTRIRKIIELHLAGQRNNDVASALSVRASTVSRILADPLVRGELDAAVESQKQRLVAMQGLAVDAVSDALTSANMGMRLRGVDRYAKMRDTLGTGDRAVTAEDYATQLAEGIARGVSAGLRQANSIDGEAEIVK